MQLVQNNDGSSYHFALLISHKIPYKIIYCLEKYIQNIGDGGGSLKIHLLQNNSIKNHTVNAWIHFLSKFDTYWTVRHLNIYLDKHTIILDIKFM